MTTKDNALRMAIEALEYHTEQTRPIQKTIDTMAVCKAALSDEAVTLPAHIKSIKIPTDTMEQEFQTHYRRGFEAGKKSVTLPDGWVAVPVEPTEQMLMAGLDAWSSSNVINQQTGIKKEYQAMLQAAPNCEKES